MREMGRATSSSIPAPGFSPTCISPTDPIASPRYMVGQSSPRELDVSSPNRRSHLMTRRGYHVSAESIVFSDGDDSYEIPRVVEEPRRQILEPLTDRHLVACLRQARRDRREDACGRPPGVLLSWHLVMAAEKVAEMPAMTQDDLFICHEFLMHFVSKEVSEYWSYVTEQNQRHHPGSEEDYLRRLVQRVQPARST